jgi:diguanylate cyclase (GGDEF)-like protein
MRLSLSGLITLIVVVGVALFAALGGYTYFQVRSLNVRMNEEYATAAQREIAQSVARVLREERKRLQNIAAWDEARQQLGTSDYYDYWRTQRVMTLDLPDYVVGVELYERGGDALAVDIDVPFTPALRNREQRPILVRERGRDYLLLFQGIAHPAEPDATLGFAVLALDLARALVPPGGLRYAALDSRVTTLPEKARVASSDIVNKVRYHVQRNDQVDEFQPLIEAAFVNVVAAILVLLLITYFGITKLIGGPLRQLSGHIEDLRNDQSQSGGIGKPFVIGELEKVRRSFNEYQSRLEVVHRGLDRKNRRLWKLAHHDPLTGCLNRRAFEDDWKHILELASKSPAGVSLILVDCNHFKAINDTYGHNVGDEVLKGIAATVRKNLQRGDRLYRIASDEFAVIFVDVVRDQASDIAKMCLSSIQQHGFTHLGVREPVRISIGVAHSMSGEPADLKGLYRRANVAMFRAKRPTEPPLAIYTPDMEGSGVVALSSRAASAVDEAIAHGQNICMNYQPVRRLSDRALAYYEALVRLRVDDRLVAPGEFFLQVETRHLDAEFDNAVFAALLRDLEQGVIPEGQGLSINMSGASVVAPDIEERLEPFTRYLPRHSLLLEVTETTLISQLQLASEKLTRLRDRGFQIALDDFGSGYSSLRYLADMPVDVVKFDISLVHAMCEGTARGRMLQKLVGLLKEPGYKLVAEGVESDAIAATAQQLGFDFGQGYLLGRPQELEPVTA